MTEEEYFNQRVEPDITWYGKKARLYRFLHISSRILIILTSAVITVLASNAFQNKDIVIAILSSVVIVVTSISELIKFKEQWFDYRATVENIKSEKAFFLTNTAPYDQEQRFHLFVKNYETIIRSENQQWKSYISNRS